MGGWGSAQKPSATPGGAGRRRYRWVVASKRQPQKSRRQQRNRAVREAREARSRNAGEIAAINRGEREPVTAAPERTTGEASPPAGSAPRRRWWQPKRESPWTIPGQRAVVLSFLFSLVSAATLAFAPIQAERTVALDSPVAQEEGATEEDDTDGDGQVSVYVDSKLFDEESAAAAVAILVVPMAITGAAVAATKHRRRSLLWSVAMLAFAMFIFYGAGSYGILTLPSLLALTWGTFQSRRADQKERMAAIEAQREERAAADDDGDEPDDVDDREPDDEPVDERTDAG